MLLGIAGNSPHTILEELKRIQTHGVVMPADNPGQIRLRRVTHPLPPRCCSTGSAIILPKRMRLVEHALLARVATA